VINRFLLRMRGALGGFLFPSSGEALAGGGGSGEVELLDILGNMLKSPKKRLQAFLLDGRVGSVDLRP
jgi:hypothetical protein